MLYIGKEMQTEISAFARRLGSDGRILVVKSCTEPVLRVMAEADDMEICRWNVDAVPDVMQKTELLLSIK